MGKVVQHLWFAKDMAEAVRFYTTLIPGSSMDWLGTLPVDTPSGPSGSVRIVEFTLGGQAYRAIEAGPLDTFNHSFSIVVECDNQDEIDELWQQLGDGGTYERCGWLRDRWGLHWQIVPKQLGVWMRQGTLEQSQRVCEAMLAMIKLDLAALEAAATIKSG